VPTLRDEAQTRQTLDACLRRHDERNPENQWAGWAPPTDAD
jgi:hypothetical protein